MRRVFSLIMVCISGFIASVMLTALSLYVNKDPVFQSLTTQQIVTGTLHPLLLTKAFWSAYPQLPPITALIHIPTLIFVGLILLTLWTRFGLRKEMSSIGIALLSQGAAAVPYAVGLWALTDNASQAYAVKWVSLMLLGVVYCSVSGMGYLSSEHSQKRRCSFR